MVLPLFLVSEEVGSVLYESGTVLWVYEGSDAGVVRAVKDLPVEGVVSRDPFHVLSLKSCPDLSPVSGGASGKNGSDAETSVN